jgi:alpha/beta superfamily hydrolase
VTPHAHASESTAAAHEIVANAVLPGRREVVRFTTEDGKRLVGELALPLRPPRHTIVCLHPNPVQEGNMDSHVLRKLAWRFPALFDVAVLRFNFRGVTSRAGTSEGETDAGNREGLDLAAALTLVDRRGLPEPWIVGWSFGTDVTLRHGADKRIRGAVLLSPPLRWTDTDDLDRWAGSGKPLVCLVPEFDSFLPPQQARERFARIPQAQVIEGPGSKHLWVGEVSVRQALQGIAHAVVGPDAELPHTWRGAMERWNDIKGAAVPVSLHHASHPASNQS